MTPERYQQIGKVFLDALELDPAERAAFLAEACGPDQELRLEVESLLKAHEQAGPYFAAPAMEVAAGWLAHQENAPLSGRSFGRYRVLSLIGAGGMGEVYLAEDTQLRRKVALKLLPQEFTQSSKRISRFEREARTASALNHPNIVTIFEVGQADGRPFIAIEYIDGDSLRKRLARARFEVQEALDTAIQIARALTAAHEAGIVHRDIKPENIMLRQDGLAKVLDFGLAKLMEGRAPAGDSRSLGGTEMGMVLGTPRYMSPEQARGEELDRRSDIFSLGVVLYEMLTGTCPFEGASFAELCADILSRDPGPLARHVKGIPAELERIAAKALAKRREERYQTAEDLIIDLRNLRLEIDVAARLQQSTPRDPQDRIDPKAIVDDSNRLQVPVERDSGGIDRSRTHLSIIARRETTARGPAEFITRNKNRFIAVGITAGLLIALVAAGVWIRTRLAATAESEIHSLAVLPLDNLSGGSDQDYFADGMTEALITELGKIGTLRVISRPSVMMYKGTRTPLPKIARDLNVDALVIGSVLRSGDRVRITTQLIETATERQRLSKSYERDGRDVLSLQREVADAIAREIEARLTPSEGARRTDAHPVNRRAYDDYLQGRYFYWNRRTEENLHKAIRYFEGAITADPGFALAYAGLADCYNTLGTVMIGGLAPTDARRRAEEAARKALELDGGLAEAHVALGSLKLYDWEWAVAEASFQRAIEINPNHASAYIQYAHYLVSQGRSAEAIAKANRARELDPLSLNVNAQRGFILENARRLDEAIDQLRRVIEMDPNNYTAHWFLGHTYAANGQFDEAIATSERAALLSGRAPGALGFLGMAYGLAGRHDEARKVLKELLELKQRDYVTPVALVSIYIGLGDKDQAFAWLEKAYEERTYYMIYLKVFPLVDPLRSDPRFEDLLRRIGLQP